MQTNFSQPGVLGWAGQIAYPMEGFSKRSKKAAEYIDFGRRLSYTDDTHGEVQMFGTNKVVLTNSGNLDASDTYTFTIKIYDIANRTETENEITTTYASSDAATMGDIVTQLEALTGIDDALTAYSSNVLTVIVSDGYLVEISDEVTGGGSTITIAKENSNTLDYAGFASFVDKEPFDLDNETVSKFKPTDVVGDIVKGAVIVDSDTGFDGGDTLYIIGYGDDRGKVSNAEGDNGIAVTDISFVKTASGANSRGVVSIDI
jgi:hypothetical protein